MAKKSPKDYGLLYDQKFRDTCGKDFFMKQDDITKAHEYVMDFDKRVLQRYQVNKRKEVQLNNAE